MEDLLERFAKYRRECDKTIKEITEELKLPKTTLYNFTRVGKMKYIYQMALDKFLKEKGY